MAPKSNFGCPMVGRRERCPVARCEDINEGSTLPLLLLYSLLQFFLCSTRLCNSSFTLLASTVLPLLYSPLQFFLCSTRFYSSLFALFASIANVSATIYDHECRFILRASHDPTLTIYLSIERHNAYCPYSSTDTASSTTIRSTQVVNHSRPTIHRCMATSRVWLRPRPSCCSIRP